MSSLVTIILKSGGGYFLPNVSEDFTNTLVNHLIETGEEVESINGLSVDDYFSGNDSARVKLEKKFKEFLKGVRANEKGGLVDTSCVVSMDDLLRGEKIVKKQPTLVTYTYNNIETAAISTEPPKSREFWLTYEENGVRAEMYGTRSKIQGLYNRLKNDSSIKDIKTNLV